jgi:Phage portal protein
MPAFPIVSTPVRSSTPIEVNTPDGFMTEPPGDLWWIGLHAWWETSIPSSVTKAESVLINPLVRMPWLVGGTAPDDDGYPAWLTDPMVLNGSTGGGNKGRVPMLDRVDRFDFWAWWIKDAMRYGIGAWVFAPDSAGQPLAGTCQLIAPWRLYRGDDGWALEVKGAMEPIDDEGELTSGERIVLLRHSIPGGVFGRHRAELQLARRARQYAGEALDTATPSGIITTDQPISQPQSDEIRLRWEDRQRRRTIAVMGNGSRYEPVVMTPVDAEVVALTNASDKQVAHMYELSSWELDAPSGDSMTYANIGEKRQDRVDGPLASWSARVEETLSALMPWGTRLRIDFTGYTKQTERGSDAPPSTA